MCTQTRTSLTTVLVSGRSFTSFVMVRARLALFLELLDMLLETCQDIVVSKYKYRGGSCAKVCMTPHVGDLCQFLLYLLWGWDLCKNSHYLTWGWVGLAQMSHLTLQSGICQVQHVMTFQQDLCKLPTIHMCDRTWPNFA